jgi:uncharacterized protein (TIGR02246 family)
MTDFVEAECRIRQLHAKYADSVWRQDFETFGECFAEDCEWRIGGAILKGRQKIVEYNRELFTTKFKKLFITLRTPVLEVGDGVASGRTYFSAQNLMADGSGFAPLGVYYERFRLEADGQWRFAWRLFQTLYSGPADLSGTFHDQPEFGPPPGMPPLDVETKNVTNLHRQGEV